MYLKSYCTIIICESKSFFSWELNSNHVPTEIEKFIKSRIDQLGVWDIHI